MRELIAEVFRRDRPLGWAGALHLMAAPVAVAAIWLDPRNVLGFDPWIKPLKFMLSVWVYQWTLALLVGCLPDGRRRVRAILSWGLAVAMTAETALITLQAARGVPSHYNIATAFDLAVFNLMGLFIAVNTVLAIWVLVLFLLPRPGLPKALLWGIRSGLAVFLLGSAFGARMIQEMAHSVGAVDGGPGLPVIGWSTVAGDLRIAHFVGVHALQVLPLVGWWLARARPALAAGRQLSALAAAAVLYAAVVGLLFAQALAGIPLLRLDTDVASSPIATPTTASAESTSDGTAVKIEVR